MTRQILESGFHNFVLGRFRHSQLAIGLAAAAMMWFGVAGAADAQASAEPMAPIALPAGFLYPNGVTQAPDGRLFVGSVVSGRIAMIDGDAVGRFDVDDPSVFAGTTLRFDAAAGRLWGASPDFLGTEQPDGTVKRRAHRIFARDTKSGVVDVVLMIPQSGFGNDIAIGADGTLFVTDTRLPRILTLPPGASRFTVLIADPQLSSDGEGTKGIGAAGIALAPDGQTLLVGIYGSGEVFAIERTETAAARSRRIVLQRPLENPDGFAIDRKGDLLLVEGGVASGNGKLTRIVDPLADGKRPVQTLVEGLDIPVNLLIDAADPNLVYVTESGLGHRFTPSRRSGTPPETFYVRRYRLD